MDKTIEDIREALCKLDAPQVTSAKVCAKEPSFNPSLIHADEDMEELTKALVRQTGKCSAKLLLYGPPGTRKSQFGQRLAESCGIPARLIHPSDVLDKYVGGTEDRIRKIFREARKEGQFMVINEIDAITADRRGADRSWERSQVGEFLTALNTLPMPTIATTNLLDVIDTAVRRPFTWKVHFDYLTPDQVRLAFQHFFGLPIPSEAVSLANLTPSDFALVAAKAAVLGRNKGAQDLLRMLSAEFRAKDPNQRRRVGFTVWHRANFQLRGLGPPQEANMANIVPKLKERLETSIFPRLPEALSRIHKDLKESGNNLLDVRKLESGIRAGILQFFSGKLEDANPEGVQGIVVSVGKDTTVDVPVSLVQDLAYMGTRICLASFLDVIKTLEKAKDVEVSAWVSKFGPNLDFDYHRLVITRRLPLHYVEIELLREVKHILELLPEELEKRASAHGNPEGIEAFYKDLCQAMTKLPAINLLLREMWGLKSKEALRSFIAEKKVMELYGLPPAIEEDGWSGEEVAKHKVLRPIMCFYQYLMALRSLTPPDQQAVMDAIEAA